MNPRVRAGNVPGTLCGEGGGCQDWLWAAVFGFRLSATRPGGFWFANL